MPVCRLPETRLRSAGFGPPAVKVFENSASMPRMFAGLTIAVPAAFVPMKHPFTELLSPKNDENA